MADFRFGWTIHRLGIGNPAGMVVEHKLRELGIPRKVLTEDLGISHAYISMALRTNGSGPSFATPVGPAFARAIAKAERERHPDLLWGAERRNPGRREVAIRDGLTLLSLYSAKPVAEGQPFALFSHLARLAGTHAHGLALRLLGEAIWGDIEHSPETRRRRVGTTVGAAGLEPLVQVRHYVNMRRDFGRMLAEADAWTGPEDITTPRFEEALARGDRKDAVYCLGGAIEGLQEEQRECDAVLMAEA